MPGGELPVEDEENSNEEHGPEGEFVGWEDENDADEKGVGDGDGVDEGGFFAEVPGGHCGGDVFTGVAAAVSPVEVHGDDVGEVQGDGADGGDDVVGGGVDAKEQGEEAGDPDGAHRGAVMAADALEPAGARHAVVAGEGVPHAGHGGDAGTAAKPHGAANDDGDEVS